MSSRVNEDDRRFDIVVVVPVISSIVSEGDDDDRLNFSFPLFEGDKSVEDDIIVWLNVKRKKEKREEGKEQ